MRTTLNPSRPTRVAAAVAAALALAACGGGDEPTVAGGGAAESGGGTSETSGSVEASPVPGIDAEHNDQDIAFITDMKPHHEGAIEMAELAATRAESAEVKDLASRIVAAQDPEIQTIEQMATAWGVDLDADASSTSMPGMDHGGGGMDMSADMDALEPLSGAEFDREFLTRMTAHHQSAIDMSEVQLEQGQNPQAKELAQEIITAQTEEIAEMADLLAGL